MILRSKTSVVWLVALALAAVVSGYPGTIPATASDTFYSAIRNNDLKTLRSLVSKTGDVNARDSRSATPLMYAAECGGVEAMKILIEAGADVNAKNSFGATALMWGITDLSKVQLLLDRKADVNARSKQGKTPLLLAVHHDGSGEIVKLLLLMRPL